MTSIRQPQSRLSADRNKTFNVFVYGTLMFEDVVRCLTDVQLPTKQATLHGYRRCMIQDPTRDAKGPVIISDKGSSVKGKVLLGANQRFMEILDLFELAAGGYQRAQGCATLQDGTEIAIEFYKATEATRELASDEDWSESEFRENYLRPYLEERIPALRQKWMAKGLFPTPQVGNP